VCNLNNTEDHALIQTRSYRERVARGVVEALSGFYSGPPAKTKKDSVAETSSRRSR